MGLYVNYTVDLGGGPDYFQAGPYDGTELGWQRKDIASYYGVSNVYLATDRDPERKLIVRDSD